MNNKFDELTKGLAQSTSRRMALKKFGIGLTGALLASLGFANKAEAAISCNCHNPPTFGCHPGNTSCMRYCRIICPRVG